MTGSCVYKGHVRHRRLKPVGHRFKYAVFSFMLDLDEIDELAGRLRFFSRGGFNLFSFYDRDYGNGQVNELAPYIRNRLNEAGYGEIGRVKLLCYPRMLGYAFNPIAVYYCYGLDDRLVATLYEVRNTFGGRHSYLAPAPPHGAITQSADKVFHVSPFNEMDLSYRFSLSPPSERLRVFVQTIDRNGPLLNAVFTGEAAALTDETLRSLFFRYPLMTLKVIFGIHLEAMKLFLKGMRLKPGAPDPSYAITVLGADGDQLAFLP